METRYIQQIWRTQQIWRKRNKSDERSKFDRNARRKKATNLTATGDSVIRNRERESSARFRSWSKLEISFFLYIRRTDQTCAGKLPDRQPDPVKSRFPGKV